MVVSSVILLVAVTVELMAVQLVGWKVGLSVGMKGMKMVGYLDEHWAVQTEQLMVATLVGSLGLMMVDR